MALCAGCQENTHIEAARLWASALPFNEIPNQCLLRLGHYGDSHPTPPPPDPHQMCILMYIYVSVGDRHVPGTETQVPHNFSQE